MKRSALGTTAVGILIAALFLSACGGAEDVESPAAEEAVESPAVEEVESPAAEEVAESPPAEEAVESQPTGKPVKRGVLSVTYGVEDCVYEGPTLLKAGPATVRFHNDGDMRAAMNFMRHDDGKSIQDMIDYLGEEPSSRHAPSWVQDLGTWEFIGVGNDLKWKFDLEPGVYTMVCQRATGYVWFGTGLTVVE